MDEYLFHMFCNKHRVVHSEDHNSNGNGNIMMMMMIIDNSNDK